MKKTASIIGFVFLLVLSCMFVVGCGDSDSGSSGSIVGKWKDNNDGSIMELTADGQVGTYMGGKFNSLGTYKTEGSDFSATVFGQDIKGTYSLSGDKLKLTIDGKDNNYTRVTDSSPAETESKAATVDPSAVDSACKSYYAMIQAGVVDGKDLGTVAKRKEFLNTATIQDALDYANLLVSDLSGLSVKSNGTITAAADDADAAKTAILSDIKSAGSLKALYE